METIATVEDNTKADRARALRFGRRWKVRRITALPRVAKCGRVHTGAASGLVAVRKGDHGAYFSGLQSCASVWACPVCQAKIGQRRAEDVSRGLQLWHGLGGASHFVTFTVPHPRNADGSYVPLAESLDQVARSFRRLLMGRSWKALRARFGIRGFVRTLEATWGEANGWHPHVHAVFLTRPLSDSERDSLYGALFGRWSAVLVRDFDLVASVGAFRAEPVDYAEGLGRYLLKMGLELHRHDLKEGSRPGRWTPFQLLDSAANAHTGEVVACRSFALWREYEAATKGRRCMTWGHGTRALLGLVDDDDQVLIDAHERGDHDDDSDPGCPSCERQGGEVVAEIDPGTWFLMSALPGVESQLLSEAERNGTDGVLLLLRTVRQRI